ncbi:MAG: hypothetical protein AB8B69_05525 [Chitinophagales bacterium]
MSRKKSLFLIDGQTNNRPILRKELPKSLINSGLIEELYLGDDIEVIGGTKYKKLKEIIITHTDLPNVRKIWRLNLEKPIPQIPFEGKKVEAAILVLTHKEEGHSTKQLEIILFELKTSLHANRNNMFSKIEGKLADSINRTYLLLMILEDILLQNEPKESTIKINFRGAICYNEEARSIENVDLYKVYKNEKPDNIINLKSILKNPEKLKVNFFKNPNNETYPESFEIPFINLLLI